MRISTTRRRSSILAGSAALLLAVTAWGGDDHTSATSTATSSAAASTEEPATNEGAPIEVLRMAYDLAAVQSGGFTWNAAEANTGSAHNGLLQLVYGALMRGEPDGTVVPDLAETVTVVDPNTVDVVMRPELTLPDGSPLDAEFVKWRLDENLKITGIPAFLPDFYLLQAVEVVDPVTVRLTIADGRAASWIDTFLARPESLMIPPDTDFTLPAGAGPYRVIDFQPEQAAVLEKNPDYWDADSMMVDRIEIVSTAGAQASVAALNAGQVDWAFGDALAIDAVGDEFTVQTSVNPQALTGFWICKTADPVADLAVRQAMSLAIDRDAVNEVIYKGLGEPAVDLWPEGHPFHNSELTAPYDPEAARQVLADAGITGDITFDLMVPGTAPGMPELAQILQQQFAEVGITANLVTSTNFVQDGLIDQLYPVVLSGVIVQPDLGKLATFSGTAIYNICGYADPALDALAAELVTVGASSDEAVDLWHQVDQAVVEQATNTLIAFAPVVTAFDASVLGGDVPVVPYPQKIPDFHSVSAPA